jgi:hypothetical protein
MNAMLAHLESFSAKQDMDSSIAIANSRLRDLTNSLSKNDWIFPNRAAPTAASCQWQYMTGSAFAHLKALLHEFDKRTPVRDLQSFFSMTS